MLHLTLIVVFIKTITHTHTHTHTKSMVSGTNQTSPKFSKTFLSPINISHDVYNSLDHQAIVYMKSHHLNLPPLFLTAQTDQVCLYWEELQETVVNWLRLERTQTG